MAHGGKIDVPAHHRDVQLLLGRRPEDTQFQHGAGGALDQRHRLRKAHRGRVTLVDLEQLVIRLQPGVRRRTVGHDVHDGQPVVLPGQVDANAAVLAPVQRLQLRRRHRREIRAVLVQVLEHAVERAVKEIVVADRPLRPVHVELPDQTHDAAKLAHLDLAGVLAAAVGERADDQIHRQGHGQGKIDDAFGAGHGRSPWVGRLSAACGYDSGHGWEIKRPAAPQNRATLVAPLLG